MIREPEPVRLTWAKVALIFSAAMGVIHVINELTQLSKTLEGSSTGAVVSVSTQTVVERIIEHDSPAQAVTQIVIRDRPTARVNYKAINSFPYDGGTVMYPVYAQSVMGAGYLTEEDGTFKETARRQYEEE